MHSNRMPLEAAWVKLWIYSVSVWLLGFVGDVGGARPRFDTSTDMGLVLVPADAEVDSVIFRLRATDQDADFPLVFDITATVTPIVRIENLPCTLYNKVCQANVILTRRLVAGRLHDFAVRVKDSKGDSNSMQATISVTNATTRRDKIFPHIPAIIMVPEDTKPGKELDYILVRSNEWSGKPVYIELWQPKELFTIRQRQTPAETRGVITLIGELDFETQSMYTLKMYATDPYTEPKKDTRNIAGLHLIVVVQDVQDVPPIFTLAPPLTKINNTVQPGDMILRVHAEDGDKGVPREVTYGLVSEGNPFTPFFNISETTGEIILARPLEQLTQITHVGAPIVLSVVAEEIRRSTMEPAAQATVVEVGLLLGEPGNSPPFFETDNYVAWMDENAEPGTLVTFTEHYSTKVRDEDIGKAGVFALKLANNNGTYEINPTVAERTANFIITVRDNSFIDYEQYKSLRFMIIAQEVGPATNLSASAPVTIFLRDVNDNPPEFDAPTYQVTISENVTAGTRVIQVHATDKDTGAFGRIEYTRIIGTGNEAFVLDPRTGVITVAMATSLLDRELTRNFELSVEARDEDGKGLRATVPLVVHLLDVNDNAPIFENDNYEFTLNGDTTNFTAPAILKATDADAEPPNNQVRYELIHGNYENKFYLDEITGELFLREPINRVSRRTRHNPYQKFASKFRNGFVKVEKTFEIMTHDVSSTLPPGVTQSSENSTNSQTESSMAIRRKRKDDDDVLFTLTARAYDLGVPHLSGVTRVKISRGPLAGARIVMFVVPGNDPDPVKTAETLAAITGGRITVQEIRPYTSKDIPNGTGTNVPSLEGEKKSIVVARVEPSDIGTSLVDIDRIRAALTANGVGVISGDMPETGRMEPGGEPKSNNDPKGNTNGNTNINVTSVHNEEVTVYRAENRLLFWLLMILGLLVLIALIALIICCICPGCPFYMAPRKRRVHSSETLIARSDGRPKRHLHRNHARSMEASWPGKKQAWSADPSRGNWQFNRRNNKAFGLASLPGDVRVIEQSRQLPEKAASLRLRDGPVPMYPTDPTRRPDEERIFMEDVEGRRGYGLVDTESLGQREMERVLDMAAHPYTLEDEQRAQQEQSKFVREQHFYRDGNAEVLRLVTRGQIDEEILMNPSHRPQNLVPDRGQAGFYRADGKDILLQRFIEDQKIRHATGQGGQDLHDTFSMESHQRQKEVVNRQQQQQQQHQKFLLLPGRLEEDHRKHIEELGPDVQRLIIDHGGFELKDRSQDILPAATTLLLHEIPKDPNENKPKEEATARQSVNIQHYSAHDLELARQNALLTRLLLERDGRDVGAVGAMVDSASYLETQSLPGQVAIATQTDRTAATQTELPSRSRSDNDESEEDARMRKKLKLKKRYGDGEPKRIRTLWMKSPIEEEDIQQYVTEKRSNVSRKKMKDVKDRRISLEPDVLREISDSLEENIGADEPVTDGRRRDDRDDSRDGPPREAQSSRTEVDSSCAESAPRERTNVQVSDKRRVVTSVPDDDAKRKHGHKGKRENTIEPSFRILEREMSSLSKKLSKLAEKKMMRYTNESETDSHEREKMTKTVAKKIDKKPECQVSQVKIAGKALEAKTKRSKSTPRSTISQVSSYKEQAKIGRDIVDDHVNRSAEYRKNQDVSTASSEIEDIVEKLKKQSPQDTNLEKQEQMPIEASRVKLKRQSKVEEKESTEISRRHLALAQKTTEQKDTTSDSTSKSSIKSGKSERESMKVDMCSSKISPSSSSDRSKTAKKTVESSGKVSREETVNKSETKSIERLVVDTSLMDTKRLQSSNPLAYSEVKIDPDTRDDLPSSLERTGTAKLENFDASTSEDAPALPKEQSVDSSSHEAKDGTRSFQADAHGIAEGVDKIEDVILNFHGENKKIMEKTESKEAIKLEDSDRFEEWEDIPKDVTKEAERNIDNEKETVVHQCEDAGMFPDNFDSFCKTNTHARNSPGSNNAQAAIYCETLRSESSEEQTSVGKPLQSEESSPKKVDSVEGIGEPEETQFSEKIARIEITAQPDDRQLESIHESSDQTLIPAIDRIVTAITQEPIATESEPGIRISKKEDHPRGFPSVDLISQPQSNDDQTDLIKTSVKSPKLERMDIVQSMDDHEPDLLVGDLPGSLIKSPNLERMAAIRSVEDLSDQVPSEGSPEKTVTLASPALSSQKEFGIADSLFVDAKLLKLSPRSPNETCRVLIDEKSSDESLENKLQIINVPAVDLGELPPDALDEDADDSDSSGASGKTTLTARPYGTPRHRPISGTDSVQATQAPEEKSLGLTYERVSSKTSITTQVCPPLVDSVGRLVTHRDDKLDKEATRETGRIEEKLLAKKSATIDDESTNVEIAPPHESEEAPHDEKASEKVQELLQIQEKLPADGFASLPETNEPLTSSNIDKLPGDANKLSMQVHGQVVKSDESGGKIRVSAKKRETSRDTERRKASIGKVVVTSTKPAAAQERKLKAESSKIGKQSIVVAQLTRPRDSKRRAEQRSVAKSEEQAARSDRVRKTRRKTDRPDKDVLPQEKFKPTKIKETLSPSENRMKQEKPKDARIKSNKEKITNIGKSTKRNAAVDEPSQQVQEVPKERVPDAGSEIDKEERPESTSEPSHPLLIEKTTSFISEPSSPPQIAEANVKVNKDGEKDDAGVLEGATAQLSGITDKIVEKRVETDGGVILKETPTKAPSEANITNAELIVSEIIRQATESMDLHNNPRVIEKISGEKVGHDNEENIMETSKDDTEKSRADQDEKSSIEYEGSSPRKVKKVRRETPETVVIESQSRYMEWYKLKREEMERKRAEKRDGGEEEEEKPKWLRKSTRQRWFKSAPIDERRIFHRAIGDTTPPTKRKKEKIKPSVNVESEQLKAIVRQGRKLRKARGAGGDEADEPQIEIFAPEKPPTPLSSVPINSRYCHQHHHLVQHSEYKYEKMPILPFYLHPPPPVPHPSPQISPQHYDDSRSEQYQSLPSESKCPNETHVQQSHGGTTKLRHQQLLEKKSVFDIAYSEAAPSQLRSDSTTPPS